MVKSDADRMTELAHATQLPGSPLQLDADFIVIAHCRKTGAIGYVATVQDSMATVLMLDSLQRILQSRTS